MSTIQMRITSTAAVILGISLAPFVGGPARAGDTVPIRLYNDGSDPIVVTVYDLNAEFPRPAVTSQRIDGFAWIPLTVLAGADGSAHIVWSARSGDESFKRCGQREMEELGDEETVHLFTDSDCARTARD
jgi:hypothetical protein